MDTSKPLMDTPCSLSLLAAAFLISCCLSSEAQTVWNVNVGAGTASGSNQITTAESYLGAAAENTANSTWNAVTGEDVLTLTDSAGSDGAGVTFQVAPSAGSAVGFGVQNLTAGDKIFNTWMKDGVGPSPDGVNDDHLFVTFGGLKPSATYDIVIYADWWWSPEGNPVQQTAGSGLSGTFHINSQQGGTHVNGVVPALMEDTDPANVATQPTNYARLRGLTPDGNGKLTFRIGPANAPINGFQLIEIAAGPPDTVSPAPNPMNWETVPTAVGGQSITMTAATASDASGVEYLFEETSGRLGGTDSGWQSSPTYTDAGLSPETTYTYTVTARDKSAARNATAPSEPASATTGAAPLTTVWNLQVASQAANQITEADDFTGAAAENTENSTWNRVAALSQADMPLLDSTGSAASGISLDLTSPEGAAIGTQNLNSGDKIFNSRIGGGVSANMTLKGLSITNSYDIVFYSDWWWGFGFYPITQTLGTGSGGTVFINGISHAHGAVPPLTQDANPGNISSGAGNTGNWHRLNGLLPDLNGEIGFRLGDGANGPFNGFQLIAAPRSPRADILAFGPPDHPALIEGNKITLTVPYATDVTRLAPAFTLYPGASCPVSSGTERDFTTPQTYTVTSSDSLVTVGYEVTVVVAPPLPEFTLSAPATWDGRSDLTVQPVITNLPLLQATGGTDFTYTWSTAEVAVIQRESPGMLTLTRSQGSGVLTVTLTMANGTTAVTRSATIRVEEPESDPWLERTPLPGEKPVDNQFFARNPFTNLGTIFYGGVQGGNPDTVYLKIYKTPSGGSETLDSTLRQPLSDGTYSFAAPVTAGLITYRTVYGTTTDSVDTDLATVTNLVCGDAYIIEGQSNAVATDNSAARDDTTSPWIRTYGTGATTWTNAQSKPTDPFWPWRIGFWGMRVAQDIVANHQMPVCIINGAVGGTRIDEHQPNPVDRTQAGSLHGIYANLLNRVSAARLTHGIRGIFWHQGESDCSNFGPILDYDHTAYERNFLGMSAAWKQDFPNFQGTILFQVMPKPCSIGPKGDELREVQRRLPRLFSKMSILNTLGIAGYEGCHFSRAGYENMAARITPLVSRDFYGAGSGAVTAPNLKRARFTSAARTAVALEFDQAMSWSAFSLPNFYVNDAANLVASGSVTGNIVTLQLSAAAPEGASLDYLKDSIWNQNESVSSLLYGANGIPALTFADVTIAPHAEPDDYTSWSEIHAPADLSDPYDDFDGDGMSNRHEYAFGLNPASSSSSDPISLPLDHASGTFSYTRRNPSLTGLAYTVWTSTTLSGWTRDEGAIQTPGSPENTVSQTVSVILSPGLTDHPSLFVRVEAS